VKEWTKIIWRAIGVVIVVGMMVSAVIWGYYMRPTERPCESVRFIIEDRNERLYVTDSELEQVLRKAEIHPVGRTVDHGVLHRIEQTIRRHPMVRTAECYTTPRAEVRVAITQRVPLLKVSKADELFYIDTDRKVMPARESIKDKVLVAKGAVGVQIATRQLADFALWLQDKPYWTKRINHLYVQSPQMIYVYPDNSTAEEIHATRLVFGAMMGYERKLKKMRTFIDNCAEPIKDKQYIEYDLRYKGQVIGRY
jgi:cell division protein FtsQ